VGVGDARGGAGVGGLPGRDQIPFRVLQKQQKLPLAERGGFKAKAQVETSGVHVEGMREQRADTGLFSNQQGALDGVKEHAFTDAAFLVLQVYCQPGEEDDGNRMLPHALADAFGRFQCVDLPDGQAEISCYAVIVANDERSCRAALLRLKGVLDQPVIKRRFAAVEVLQMVMLLKGFR